MSIVPQLRGFEYICGLSGRLFWHHAETYSVLGTSKRTNVL